MRIADQGVMTVATAAVKAAEEARAHMLEDVVIVTYQDTDVAPAILVVTIVKGMVEAVTGASAAGLTYAIAAQMNLVGALLVKP